MARPSIYAAGLSFFASGVNMLTRISWLAVVGCVFAAQATFVFAQEKPEAEVAAFLEKYWKASSGTEANQEVDQQFAKLQNLLSGDARAYYAHSLICMRQRRFEKADQTAGQLLSFEETHLGAHRVKIWLALLNKNYGEAVAATQPAAEIAVKTAADSIRKEEAEDMIRFLGVVFGFLEGPVGEVPGGGARLPVEKKIVAMLSDEQKVLFNEARQAVLEKHSGLLNAKEDKKEKAAADEEAEKERKLAEIEARRKDVGTERESLRDRRKELEGRLREEQAAFNKVDGPLAEQQNRLESQGIAMQSNLNAIQIQLSTLEAAIAAEKDRTRQSLLQLELSRLTRIASNLNGDFFALRRTAQGIIYKRQSLANQAARTQQDLGGQISNIDKDASSLLSEEKRMANIERQTLKGGSGSSGKTQALSLTASALNTYEPFPLDQEKARLMATLK